ncbi:hypothetical protein PLICRDRAFT_46158 [Plicaturopsis crispa FD-325 SS-3]|uniref:Uncharacterized protein n=1 Tax=Plicaturopsis crispa FD-325 SS-3 TaxID=944288 RepID=A0A0C9SR36_PLICR|nr:hypothetical protein PLICRDRAFT_46158 [Plicaturopsis crispa FD-325 SS-3]
MHSTVAAAEVVVVADYGDIAVEVAVIAAIVADIQAAVGTDTARTAAAEDTAAAGVGAGRSAQDSRTVDSRTAAVAVAAGN